MLTPEHSALLIDGAKFFNVELTEEHLSQIAVYIGELKRWARIVNLVSQPETEAIIRKHILDSLAALTVLPPNGHVLDVGSGAGFPGLPLAIASPTLSVTLLEPRRKRVNFLKEVIRKAKLTNIHVYEGRIEELKKSEKMNAVFEIIITRATWNIREFLTLVSPFLSNDGIMISMKGSNVEAELKNEASWLSRSGCILKSHFGYILPFGDEKRALLVFSLS
jgi:16S rRNA (guanine527-N7)-methyltransferase